MFKRKEKIQYIILHYSASTRSDKNNAQGTVKTLDNRGFSSDFAVDDDNIIQFADDPANWASTAVQRPNKNGTAAGQGARNSNAVSIEMSSTLEGGRKEDWKPNNPKFKFSDKVLANTAYLCKILIQKYNIPKQNIIRHYDIMGKCCPGIIGWNLGSGSNNETGFRNFVNSLYSGGSAATPVYEQMDYTSSGSSSGGSGGGNTGSSSVSAASSSGGPLNVPNVPNNVSRLASSKKNKSVLKQSDSRKAEFEALANSMSGNAPQMGRGILLTSEMYDSNILKGSQESRKERTK